MFSFLALTRLWLPLSLLGHALNGAAFVIDKTLLRSAFKRPPTYALLIAGMSFLAVFFLPFVRAWPAWSAYPAILAFGALFLFALWAFFFALQAGEASRVVPMVGSLIPVFTFVGSGVFLHETWGSSQLLGFACLIFATVLLTRGGSRAKRLTRRIVLLALISSVLFAAASVCGKIAYQKADPFSVFVLSRFGAVIAGLVIAACDRAALAEARGLFFSQKKNRRFKTPFRLALLGQVFGGTGFILLNIALVAGSAAVINALQAVQYALIVISAWLGGKKLRLVLQEERTPRIVLTKSCALVIVALGLVLVSR